MPNPEGKNFSSNTPQLHNPLLWPFVRATFKSPEIQHNVDMTFDTRYVLWRHSELQGRYSHRIMMTSSNRNIFHGESPAHQWRGALMFSMICAWISGWVNNHEADDLRRHCAHYDVTVMITVGWDARPYATAYIITNGWERGTTTHKDVMTWRISYNGPFVRGIAGERENVIKRNHLSDLNHARNLNTDMTACVFKATEMHNSAFNTQIKHIFPNLSLILFTFPSQLS